MIPLSCFLLLHTLGAPGPAKCAELFIKLAIARKFRIKNVMEAPLLGQEEQGGTKGSSFKDYKCSNRWSRCLVYFM